MKVRHKEIDLNVHIVHIKQNTKISIRRHMKVHHKDIDLIFLVESMKQNNTLDANAHKIDKSNNTETMFKIINQ